MGTGQNFTKTKFHKVTKLHNGTKLHENKIAQRYFCTKRNLHEGTKLHQDNFAPKVNFARVTF